jgi:hypothetical protein
MAITIDFEHGDFEEGRNLKKPSAHTKWINNLLGVEFKSKTIFEDEETWVNVYLYNNSLSLEDIKCWDDLGEYANENSLYIYIYDHDKKTRKGYQYDEDQEWLDMTPGERENYEANSKQ